ncbi:hypothetical protein [Staphylococcus phage SA3]|uniref:Membrane protein n=8 Tax=Kayvirus TaxID=1857843 RepID=I6P9V0_BPG15|nr:hypothetical protein F360_gp197 [Staphylococcus phage G15]YP_009099435.1 hypothetical protein P108_0098 [Staphylococcus phage P108]ARQ96169.1 putative membrane protein [Staphylococcus phage qdsa002]ASZ78118.1 hypothetical protein [Staphylococcus phage SA3]AUG85621.1 putative membrane protein [Staphylococcus phage HSA30]AXU40145.1 putative membrane protein [Staphylococcus phage VB_SavM_JYL01]AZU97551.1 putative membrane protein [Staphylococcus phage VB-SavM-JYL02]QEQ93213.1 putative membra
MVDIIILIVGLILFLASGYKLVLGKYYDNTDLKMLFTIFGIGTILLLVGFIL